MRDEEILDHPAVRKAIADKLAEHQRAASGSATRVMRVMLMREPLRFEKGEVTDKGSINQRAVLAHRGELVEALYGDGRDVIRVEKELAA